MKLSVDHEPGHGHAYPQRLPQIGALPRVDAVTDHAGLHGHGDDQGPGRGGHAHIGDGKRQHVSEQRQGRAPAALPPPVRHLSVTPLTPPVQDKKHQGAGRHADGRITDRIHAVMQHGKAAQDGVEGKKGHAQQRQERQRQAFLPEAACCGPRPRYGSFRIRHLFPLASRADATAIQKKSFINDKQNPYLLQSHATGLEKFFHLFFPWRNDASSRLSPGAGLQQKKPPEGGFPARAYPIGDDRKQRSTCGHAPAGQQSPLAA